MDKILKQFDMSKSEKIKQIYSKATASELCLIEAVMVCCMEEARIEFLTVYLEEFVKQFKNSMEHRDIKFVIDKHKNIMHETKNDLGLMNNYTDWKVYVLGQWIKNGHEEIPPFGGEWLDLLKFEDFKSFRTRHEITDKQLALIKKGFHGWDFPDYSTPKEAEPIMPFGQHKGKYFSQISQDYWLFLGTQSWLDKWPSVKLHVRNILAEMNENAASKEETKEIFKNILQEIQ